MQPPVIINPTDIISASLSNLNNNFSNLNAALVEKTVITVGTSSGADYICDGTADDIEIGLAISVVNGLGGGAVLIRNGAYSIVNPITLYSNVMLIGESKGGVTLSTSMAGTNGQGVLIFTNCTQIEISRLVFNISGASTAITSYGHDTISITDCIFTGTGSGSNGVIALYGQTASTTFNNTTITSNRFISMINSVRTVYLYSRNGHRISNTKIYGNHFESTKGPSVYLDDYDLIRGTLVSDNTFLNILPGGTTTTPGVALFAGLAGLSNYILETEFSDNFYYNTGTGAGQGMVYIYSATGVVINDNIALGSWTPLQQTVGPCIAPGRTSTPITGMTVVGNYINGFDAPWDPDSMRFVDVSDNIVENCGGGLNLGYNIQEYVKIHHNTHRNSPSLSPYFAGILFDNSNPKKCEISDNVYIDDRPIAIPTGVTAALSAGGTLTVGTPYYYKVTALDLIGETLGSSEVSATPTTGNQKIKVSWNNVSGVASYNLYRTTTSGSYPATSLVTNVVANVFYDGGTTLTSGTVPSMSTVATTVMQRPTELTGNFNFSDVVVKDNRFYAPGTTLTTLFYKELGGEVAPLVVHGNEVHDATGITREFPYSQGNVTASTTFNVANGNIISAMLTGNITVTLTSGSFIAQTLELRLTQDATGSRTVTWPSNFKKASGTLTLSTAANAVDTITMRWDGTNWREIGRAMNQS